MKISELKSGSRFSIDGYNFVVDEVRAGKVKVELLDGDLHVADAELQPHVRIEPSVAQPRQLPDSGRARMNLAMHLAGEFKAHAAGKVDQ